MLEKMAIAGNQEFDAEYKKFCSQFDKLISRSFFTGIELDKLSQEFLSRCESRFNFHSVQFSVKTKFPNCSQREACEDDHKLLESLIEDKITPKPSEDAKILADVYRRICQGSYMRATFNKSRKNQEDDRREAVNYGRYAIRYNPNDFEASYFYMISLGWFLDPMKHSLERIAVAKLFKLSTLRNIQMRPEDPLAHSLLGRYNYRVSNLSWLEKAFTKRVIGCDLDGSLEEAEREFKFAHSLKDDWMPTGLWMARVLLALKRPMAEVKQWIDLASSLECLEPSSEIERQELIELKAKLKISN